jgi:peroxiredoxin
MKKVSAVALLVALSLAVGAAALRTGARGSARDDKPAPAVALGAVVADFTLPDPEGHEHTLASLKGKNGTVIIFIATRCPVSNGYNERMEKLATDYASRGVNVVGINANSTEPVEEVKQHAKDKGFTFVVLKDKGSQIADRFDAQVTPEAYLLDASGKLVYHGPIDNSRNPENITSNYLRDAIEAMLAGKPVQKPEAKAFGCTIKRG